MQEVAGRRLNVAQIGAGYWGPNLIRNLLPMSEIDSFTVCDHDENCLAKICSSYPLVQTSTSAQNVLEDPSVDAIIIALPASLHYEFASKALRAGKHVFVEKPLATTALQAQELVALSQSAGKVLMVGHTFLFNPAVDYIKQYVNSGELGEVYYIICERLNLGRVRQDINAWWNLAPHDISIVLDLFDGEMPSWIDASGHSFLQNGIEDVVFANLRYPSGRAAHIHVSWLHPRKTRTTIVVGSKKMLIYDDVSSDAKVTIYDKGIEKKCIPRDLPAIESFGQFQFIHRMGDVYIPKINFKEPLQLECRHFIDCIINNSKPKSDGINGLRVVEILEKVQNKMHQPNCATNEQ